ncbi:MAG: esterase-like activity of phytase family protein, partial [Chitinophagaceae bacterium]
MQASVKVFFFSVLSVALFACTAQRTTTAQTINSLRFLGEYSLPHKMQFQKTTVGGLSSIDYSTVSEEYYLICDDRSDINPARFYKAKIAISERGIDSVQITGVVFLKQK